MARKRRFNRGGNRGNRGNRGASGSGQRNPSQVPPRSPGPASPRSLSPVPSRRTSPVPSRRTSPVPTRRTSHVLSRSPSLMSARRARSVSLIDWEPLPRVERSSSQPPRNRLVPGYQTGLYYDEPTPQELDDIVYNFWKVKPGEGYSEHHLPPAFQREIQYILANPPERQIKIRPLHQVMGFLDFTNYVVHDNPSFAGSNFSPLCDRLVFTLSENVEHDQERNRYFDNWHVYVRIYQSRDNEQNDMYAYVATIGVELNQVPTQVTYHVSQHRLFPQSLEESRFPTVDQEDQDAVDNLLVRLNESRTGNWAPFQRFRNFIGQLYTMKSSQLRNPNSLSTDRDNCLEHILNEPGERAREGFATQEQITTLSRIPNQVLIDIGGDKLMFSLRNACLNNFGYYTETWDHYVWLQGDANDPQNNLYAYVCSFVSTYRRLADGTPVRNHIQWVDDQAPIINLSRYPMISQEEQTSVMNYHSTIMQNEDQFQSFTDPLINVRSSQMGNVNRIGVNRDTIVTDWFSDQGDQGRPEHEPARAPL